MLIRSFQIGLLFFLFLSLSVISSETNKKQIKTERSGYWTYYCVKDEKQKQCKIARKIIIEKQNDTFLIIYDVTKGIDSKVKESLNISTPSASRVNIKKRLKISFDNKTKFTRSFLKCESDSCLVMFKGGKILKYSLKNFKKIKITFYSSEDEEPISLTLPIDGFAKALNNVNQQLESY
jgi:invasion protein IalB|tara:strand:+ start:196 stop:732 length:537 start_codon:yes stop_codon:yes gene_type:complete